MKSVQCSMILAGVALLMSVSSTFGQDPGTSSPAEPISTNVGSVAISSTHRFAVSGMSLAENVALAASVEDVVEKVEGIIGARLPYGRGHPLLINARARSDTQRGYVVKAQGWVDRSLAQKLIIINPAATDQEDVLEGLCWLLLNRYVISRQDAVRRNAQLGAVPDWLSTGLAQDLFPELRARNSRVVLQYWMQGESLPMAELLNYEYLPEGRWSEKAFCGLAFEWFVSQPRPGERFAKMFSRLAVGEKITGGWLSKTVFEQASTKELEKAWDLWLAEQTQVKRAGGELYTEQLDALRRLLIVRPAELGMTIGEKVPSALKLADLIRLRKESWVPALAIRLSLKVKSLGIGEPAEFREVADGYGAFLDTLARCGPGGFFGWFRPSEATLRAQLEKAEKDLGRLRRSVDAGGIEWATGLSATGAAISNTEANIQRFIPRSELQRLADEPDHPPKPAPPVKHRSISEGNEPIPATRSK